MLGSSLLCRMWCNRLLNVIRLQSAAQQIIRARVRRRRWRGMMMTLHCTVFSFNCCVNICEYHTKSSFTAKLNDEANMRYVKSIVRQQPFRLCASGVLQCEILIFCKICLRYRTIWHIRFTQEKQSVAMAPTTVFQTVSSSSILATFASRSIRLGHGQFGHILVQVSYSSILGLCGAWKPTPNK